MLFLNNDDVKQVLTMELTMNALDHAYRELARQEAVCRPRIDVQIPTSDPDKIYQWGTMEGGSMSGYFAIRMKSDVIYEQEYQGAITQEKYCVRPGNFCGLILLNRHREWRTAGDDQRRLLATHARRRRFGHRRQVHGASRCYGRGHDRVRRHGALPCRVVFAGASQAQKDSSLQSDQGQP